jgi:hypothetical protein
LNTNSTIVNSNTYSSIEHKKDRIDIRGWTRIVLLLINFLNPRTPLHLSPMALYTHLVPFRISKSSYYIASVRISLRRFSDFPTKYYFRNITNLRLTSYFCNIPANTMARTWDSVPHAKPIVRKNTNTIQSDTMRDFNPCSIHCRVIPRVRVEGAGPRGSWTREWRSDGGLTEEKRGERIRH